MIRRAVFFVVVLLLASSVYAQIDTASITGRITDPTGAVVIGAEVRLANTETNVESVSQSNEEGMYRVQPLRPGPYRMTVVASGFKRLVREGLELRLGEIMAVNVTLEVGAVAESVEVRAVAPLLETETSSTGQVVEGNYLYRLPLYQRAVKMVVFFTPGLTISGTPYPGAINGYHIAGMRNTQISYFEDGMLGIDVRLNASGWTTGTIQNTAEEVKVVTTAPPAEYGHSAGGAITVVKKSGTNQLHGLISQYGRVRRMQHRKFFDLYRNSQPRPGLASGDTLLFQMPDANINGPVYLPKLYDGHNRTFFMFAVERLLEKQGRQGLFTVPTDEMLNGDLRFGGIGNPIFDPRTTRQLENGNWTRDPFPNNLVPKSQFDPVAAKILSFNPWVRPNRPGTINTSGPANNLYVSPMGREFWENYSWRLDHQFNPNVKIYGTWTYNSKFSFTPNATVSYTSFRPSERKTMRYFQTASVGNTWVISPTLVSDARLGFYRREDLSTSPAYLANIAGMLGIPGLPPDTFPEGIGVYDIGVTGPNTDVSENFSFKEDLSKTRGVHAFKMGYELMRLRQNSYGVGSPSGSFSYAGANGLLANGTAVPNTGNSFAAFLVGAISSASFSRPLASWLPRVWMHSFYFQDDWKVNSTLTLNLGVRYSLESPQRTKWNQISQWDPSVPDDVVAGGKGAFVHPQGGLHRWDTNNFQPRFGMAWHPLSKVVVRGGFALSTIDLLLYGDYRSEYSESTYQQRPPGDPRPLYQLSRGPDPIVYPARRADGTFPFQGSNYGSRGAARVDPALRNPYGLSWNLGIQYELGRNYVLETMYQGSAAVGLIEQYEINALPWGYLKDDAAALSRFLAASQNYRPWPNYGNISLRSNFGHSTYHSGTVKIEKRYSKGLNFLTFYTWSKAIDSNDNDGGGGNILVDQKRYKARAGFDQAHRFSSSMTYEIPIGKGRRWLGRGGIVNLLLGGYDFVWTYSIITGNPASFSFSGSPYQYYPSWMGGIGGRPNVLQTPHLRDNWQDIGADRFTPANQNGLIESIDYFAYPAAFTEGNSGRNIMGQQRQIAASLSASKEVAIKERLKFQFRFDFQNPLKWYNWGSPSTTVDFRNPRNFGTISSGSEFATANYGGLPMMNITFALKW